MGNVICKGYPASALLHAAPTCRVPQRAAGSDIAPSLPRFGFGALCRNRGGVVVFRPVCACVERQAAIEMIWHPATMGFALLIFVFSFLFLSFLTPPRVTLRLVFGTRCGDDDFTWPEVFAIDGSLNEMLPRLMASAAGQAVAPRIHNALRLLVSSFAAITLHPYRLGI